MRVTRTCGEGLTFHSGIKSDVLDVRHPGLVHGGASDAAPWGKTSDPRRRMNTDRFSNLLERAFASTPVTQLQDGQVRQLQQPRPLAPLLDQTLEGEEEVELYRGTFEVVARERRGAPQ